MNDHASIADELAIRSLLVELAIEGDSGSPDAYADLFTEDAVLESPGGRSDGRPAILASTLQRREAGMIGPGSGARHLVTPGLVEVDNDCASSRSYFSFFVTVDGQTRLAMIGDYHDEFRRSGGLWRLARRTVVFT